MTPTVKILQGHCLDVLRTLPDESVNCVVTSPPYWGLRDYGTAQWEGGDPVCDHRKVSDPEAGTRKSGLEGGKSANGHQQEGFKGFCGKCGARRKDQQIGLEATPQEYVAKMVEVFREVRRVLRGDGTCWVNLGSSYAGGAPGSGGKSPKQITNAGSFFDGKSANPSLRQQHDPACGSDGTGLRDSCASDHVCPDCGGELTACSLIHHARNAHTSQLVGQCWQPLSPTVRGSEHSDCASTLPVSSETAAPKSTISSCNRSGLDAASQDGQVLVSRLEAETLRGNGQAFADNLACRPGTAPNDHPSSFRTSGTAFVCVACGYSTRLHPRFKPKDMVPIPWMVAMALQADGWYLRSDIIWHKPNPMPESVTDRPTKAHEYIFLLSKSERYAYDCDAIREKSYYPEGPNSPESIKSPYGQGFTRRSSEDLRGKQMRRSDLEGFGLTRGTSNQSCEHPNGRNKRTVWTVPSAPFSDCHFATFPPDLIKPCILAGCPVGGTVLDPFLGSGTTAMVALELGRKAVGIELNPDYIEMAKQRCNITPGLNL